MGAGEVMDGVFVGVWIRLANIEGEKTKQLALQYSYFPFFFVGVFGRG